MPDLQLHVNADTKSARDEFKALGNEASKSFAELGEQGQIAAKRIGELDKYFDSPGKLGKAAAIAALEVEELRAALEKAGKLTPDLAKAFTDAGAKIEAASTRSRQFADVMDDMRVKGETSAKGIEAVAQRTGDLGGVLDLLKTSGFSGAEGLEKVAFSVMALQGGIQLAITGLDAVSKAMKAMADDYAAMAERTQQARTRTDEQTAALAAVAKGYIEAGKTAGETAERYKTYVELTQRGTQATDAFAKALAGLKPPEALDQLKQKATDVETALALAFKEGRLRDYAAVNKDTIDQIVAEYQKLGLRVPEYVQKAAQANEEMAKSEQRAKQAAEDAKKGQEDKLKAMVDVWNKQQEAITQGEALIKQYEAGKLSYKEQTQGLAEIAAKYGLTTDGLIELIQKNRDYKAALDEARVSTGRAAEGEAERAKALDDLIARMERQEDQIRRLRQAEDERSVAAALVDRTQSGYLERQAAMNEMLQQNQDAVAKMTITWVTFTQATDAAIDALVRGADKFAEIDEKMGRSSANMVDYAANIREAFQTGFTDMITVLGQLDEAIQQMMVLKMRNAGTVFEEEISKMLEAYQQLRQEIASGGVAKAPKMKGTMI